MKLGRGGACVPARVAPQGRIHRSIPHTQCVYFLVWKRCCADVRAGTQAPPLRFRLGRLRVAVDTVWVDWTWVVDVVGKIVHKWLFCLCEIAWKDMMEIGRGGAYVPARVAP